MSEFEFGQRVRFSNPLVRRSVYPEKKIEVEEDWFGQPRMVTKHINREWQPNQWAGEKEGMVIGKRTISDGYAEYDNDYGASYCRGVNHVAYLVVADMRSKPVLVLPENITAVPNE
jgi:hypothetical protein